MKKYDIFISHSRKYGDNEIANLIYDKLSPYYSVYLDIKTQDLGRFDKLLEEYISKCKDFILIISKDFLERDSWVRQEVKWAMKYGINIIPVYIDANNISGNCFPEGLEEIAKISWVEYHEKRVDDVIRVIVKYLKTKSNVKKCIICSIMWIFSIVSSLFGEFFFYDSCPKDYQWAYLIISFSFFLPLGTYFKNLIIDIFNYFSTLKQSGISKKKEYYCYRYFYYNRNDERKTIFKQGEFLGSTIILWSLSVVLPMVWISSFIKPEIMHSDILELICRKIVCISFSILFMFAYIENIFENSVKYWNMNRKHVIITGEGNIQYIEESKEFKQWILHMCQEDAVFYLEKNTRMQECILGLLQRFIEYSRTMKMEDYVKILKKENLKNIDSVSKVNACKVCYIHLINKDEYWNDKDKEIKKGTKDKRFLGNYENILIFRSKEQSVDDCSGNAVIKEINQLANIWQIMENEIFNN